MFIAYSILTILRFPVPKETVCLFELSQKETKWRHFLLSQIRQKCG